MGGVYEQTKNGLKLVTKKTEEYAGKSSPAFYLRKSLHDLVLYFHADHGSDEKQYSQALCLEDAEFSHAGAQCAAIESKDLGRPVFSADFPLSLLEDSHNMFALNRFERFLGRL